MQTNRQQINPFKKNPFFYMVERFIPIKLERVFQCILILLPMIVPGMESDTPVKVSQWGFKPDDATECLQKAINSGARKLIIDNTGHDWLISKTVRLTSNQELILANGVALCAKPGTFKGIFEPLLAGYNIRNVVIRGEGNAVLRMNKKDYQDSKLYQFSEWRHGIFLAGCANVTIRDFTIRETGGDGIALGNGGENPFCQNILVDNMILDGNHRLAMGVVSVDGLILRNSKLINTLGTPPASGIDFEPNRANERIANVLIENCVFDNNQQHAIVVSTQSLTAESAPVSLTVRNCNDMKHNTSAFSLMPLSLVKGNILIENCDLNNFVTIRNCTEPNFKINFKNVTINLPDKSDYTPASIMINCTGIPAGCQIGGIEFDNVRVNDPVRPPLGFNFSGQGRLADSPSGTLFYNEKPFDLRPIITEAQRYTVKLNSLQPAVCPKLTELRPPTLDSLRPSDGEIPLRAITTMLQYGEEGKPVTVKVRMNRYYHSEGKLEVYQPSGKLLSTVPVSCDEKNFQPVTFTPPETGIYRLICVPGINSILVDSTARGNGLLIDKDVLTLLKPKGRLYFRVPAGVREFSLGIAGSPSVNSVLRNQEDKVVHQKNNIGSMALFSATRPDSSKDEIWSIDLSCAVWLVTLRLYAPLIPIVSTNPDTLFL